MSIHTLAVISSILVAVWLSAYTVILWKIKKDPAKLATFYMTNYTILGIILSIVILSLVLIKLVLG